MFGERFVLKSFMCLKFGPQFVSVYVIESLKKEIRPLWKATESSGCHPHEYLSAVSHRWLQSNKKDISFLKRRLL